MNAIVGVGNSWGLIGNSWGKGGMQESGFLRAVLTAQRLHESLTNSWWGQNVLEPEQAGKQAQAGSCWSDGHIDLQA